MSRSQSPENEEDDPHQGSQSSQSEEDNQDQGRPNSQRRKKVAQDKWFFEHWCNGHFTRWQVVILTVFFHCFNIVDVVDAVLGTPLGNCTNEEESVNTLENPDYNEPVNSLDNPDDENQEETPSWKSQ